MVVEGQRLSEGVCIASSADCIEGRDSAFDGRASIHILGRETSLQPRPEHVRVRRELRKRSALKRGHARGIVRETMFAQPEAAESKRGARQ
jgi:hypothetical protein